MKADSGKLGLMHGRRHEKSNLAYHLTIHNVTVSYQ
jgi:hypothetical protein